MFAPLRPVRYVYEHIVFVTVGLVELLSGPHRKAKVITNHQVYLPAINRCNVVGVNRVGTDGAGLTYGGDSMVADSLGSVLYQKENAEDIFTISLDKKHLTEVREKLPFWKEADPFILVKEPATMESNATGPL